MSIHQVPPPVVEEYADTTNSYSTPAVIDTAAPPPLEYPSAAYSPAPLLEVPPLVGEGDLADFDLDSLVSIPSVNADPPPALFAPPPVLELNIPAPSLEIPMEFDLDSLESMY